MLNYANLEPYCPNGCQIAPRCPKCGAVEVLATGLDYYCPDCKVDLREMMALLPIRTVPMAYPGVAIGVLVFDTEGRVLLGKRKGELGDGEYSLPGGKVDFGETPYQAAIREVKEETNLEFSKEIWGGHLMFTGQVTNDYFPDKGKQYITLYYMGTAVNPEELKVMEPDKIEGWTWYSRFDIPQPIWMHTGKLLQTVMTGANSGPFKNPDIDGEN